MLMRHVRRLLGPIILAASLVGAAGALLAQSADPARDPERPSPEQWERTLKKRLAGNSRDHEAAYELAKHYYNQGNRDQAEKGFRRVLSIKGDYVPALVNLGVVLNEAGKSEEAIPFFDQALAVSPGDGLALCHKGQALYALKRHEEAIRLYLEALERHPGFQLAHYWLGIAFADAGIYREALVEWRRVVSIDPESEIGRAAAEGIEVVQPLIGGP